MASTDTQVAAWRDRLCPLHEGRGSPSTGGRWLTPSPGHLPTESAGRVSRAVPAAVEAGHSPATCSSSRCSRGRRMESCSTVQVMIWGMAPSAGLCHLALSPLEVWMVWKCLTTEWITKLLDCRDMHTTIYRNCPEGRVGISSWLTFKTERKSQFLSCAL